MHPEDTLRAQNKHIPCSSSIQTILSVSESHRFGTQSARGLYRRWGLAPRPEELIPYVVIITVYAVICKHFLLYISLVYISLDGIELHFSFHHHCIVWLCLIPLVGCWTNFSPVNSQKS